MESKEKYVVFKESMIIAIVISSIVYAVFSLKNSQADKISLKMDKYEQLKTEVKDFKTHPLYKDIMRSEVYEKAKNKKQNIESLFKEFDSSSYETNSIASKNNIIRVLRKRVKELEKKIEKINKENNPGS